MSEDDTPPPRFAGRTYSRSKPSRAIDETSDGKTVPLKAAVSMSKWGKANYVPFRESADGASDVKRIKMECKPEDPFSFDTEDKRKLSPVKKQAAPQQPEPRQSTKLPASRILVKGEGSEEYFPEKINEVSKSPAFRTYTRATTKKPIIMEQFIEVGKVSLSSESLNYHDSKLSSSQDSFTEAKEDSAEDDEIFPVQFKREPLKTYSGEVVTPVDKPDSPPPRKSGYKKKGGPRGRKPLTVSDPDLIEEYKRNYAAQQLKSKPDTATGGLNNSMVVSKEEMANEDQGTTVVVVCKPKGLVEKTDVHTKYFAKPVKSKGGLVQVSSDASSQDTVGENGNTDSTTSTPVKVESVPTHISSRHKNVSYVAANSEGLPSQGSNASNQSSPSTVSPVRRVAQGRGSNLESSPLVPTPGSTDSSSQGDGSLGRGKRYRIFKSRAPQVEEELKPPIYGDELMEDEESPLPCSEQAVDTSVGAQSLISQDDKIVYVEIDVAMEESSSLTQQSSNNTGSAEPPSTVETDSDPSIVKQNDPSAARELLAARLRNMEKGNDSDSTGEPDNMSECSENLQSQESPFNNQNTHEEVSQKEVSSAPRKFFKSKKSLSGSSELQRKIFGGSPQKGSPAKATYNARSWYTEHDADDIKEELSQKGTIKKNEKDEDIVIIKDSSKGPQLKREVHWPERQYDEAYTSLRVSKTHKELYTVVHNVKQTHEVQELGETQDFMDEVDYLLDSLQDTKSKSIRCLSCLKLAGKCISPAFRMHMRAHGTVAKIFSLLHDACTDPCLALSTSAMMFMLSRDRLNMDLDQHSLNLMLKLNEVDTADAEKATAASLRDLEKTKQRVQELLAQLQQETHAREIDLGFVSTGNLAMESLLSLTSRRAGEWFKEELRIMGGLDHIVDSVTACERNLPEDLTQDIQNALPVLRKLDRCLRVLENISSMNADNQFYLISYKNASLLQSCTRTLRLCQQCMPTYAMHESPDEDKTLRDTPGYTVLTCMLAVLRVLLNVTHEHKLGDLDSAAETSLIETILKCLTTTQWCIPVEQRFDMAVLCLGLLINLVENRHTNRKIMMEMETQVKYTERAQAKTMSAIKAVVELFVQREQAAREMEEDNETSTDTSSSESPNKSGEWKESDSGIEWITNSLKKAKEEEEKMKKSTVAAKEGDEANQSILEDDEETFTKALHKAGKHMENSIVASYAGLLLGTTIIDDKEYAATVKKLIPNEDFGPMIKMLKKFLNFMSLTTAFGSTDVNGITKVIDVLESA
ncbi:unnamed protein product [Lymnaea stagnalis]|uniref:WAPL domain-containing protein n=1 Tax=Lymnaea stagnalis TaxID=6523 RepID=A0AAV2HU82_LYMST